MNTAAHQNHSLREILARRGIESSCERDRKHRIQRIERRRAAQQTSASPLPGIEVSYLEFDPDEWRKFETATWRVEEGLAPPGLPV